MICQTGLLKNVSSSHSISAFRVAAEETKNAHVEEISIVSACQLVNYFNAQASRFYGQLEIEVIKSQHSRILSWAIRRGKGAEQSVLLTRLNCAGINL